MKNILIVLLIAVVTLCGYAFPCHAQNTVELLVVLNKICKGAAINNAPASAKKTVKDVDVLNHLPKSVISSYLIPGSSILRIEVPKDSVEKVIREIKEQKNVLSVEISNRGRIENSFPCKKDDISNSYWDSACNTVAASSDKSDWCKDSDWYKDIDGQKIGELSSGEGVIVAVIDTGIDLKNSLFSSCVFVNTGEITGDLIDNDGNGYVDDCGGWDMGDGDNDPQDENGHGTEVASVILSLSPHCKILPIKVNQSASDSFSTADLVEGIYYAVSSGAKVINLSLTVDQDSESVKVAVQSAHDAGAIVVAAAGNDSGGVDFPASMDEVIAVGGLYNDSAAWFSPQGPAMEIMAPGVAVKLVSLDGEDVYASGTSFSCAMVSGTAADLFGMNPHLKNKTVRLLLDSGARDLGDSGKDDVYGEGALDGNMLFNVSVPRLTLPVRPFYAFSKEIPISVSFHIPPTDTSSNVYVGVLSPDGSLWLLDAYGIWHDSNIEDFFPIANLAPLSEPADGVLFGENGVFQAFNPAFLSSGLYQWGIAVEDESGKLLGPVVWNYMLLF